MGGGGGSAYHLLVKGPIALVDTQMYCKNPSVKMSIIEVFMKLWKLPKMDLGSIFFFLLTFQIPLFLNAF